MSLIFRSIADYSDWRRRQSGSVGFVPTMGALHEGHAELLRRSVSENPITVLSIFVNPTQFNDPKDFEKYPITWEQDIALAQKTGVTAVLAPQKEDFYPDNYRYRVTEGEFSKQLCGAHRPGHFDGVLTIVMRLFNVVRPDAAYFGEKDYQQLKLIEGMTKAFFMGPKIVPVPTVREKDGLAMSSRNTRLNPEQRALAPEIYKAMTQFKKTTEAREHLEQRGFRVDYLEDIDGRRFCAAFLGDVRLIDNVAL